MDMKLVMSKVFAWMFVGLLITFLTGYVVSINTAMLANVLDSWLLIVLLVVELGLVLFLAGRIFKMKPITAKISFLLYSFVSGLTFSVIFITYDMTSVIYVFLATSLIFGILALIGYTTKIDLSKLGNFLLIALICGIIVSVLNFLFNNVMLDMIISIAMVVIFLGFTAFDMQKIKRISENNPAIPEDNLAIYGALELYLDFINLFIELLNIFGNSKD